MVQRIWRQLTEARLEKHTYIVTGNDQKEMIYNQLGDHNNLIIEPERRDTFAAILLSMSYLHTCTDITEDETVVVMPVDPYVDTSFFSVLHQLNDIVQQTDVTLALMGAKPTHPSEKYGYIVPEKDNELLCYHAVKQFIEKPAEAVANRLIYEGALWNCGIFAGKLKFFLNLITNRNLPLSYHELLQKYGIIRKVSFDYEVVERQKNIAVVPYIGNWKDLGTWNTLTEEMQKPIVGKGICSRDSLNTHIINELDIPIAVLGVCDLVIAASPDGILVADKAQSPRIKEVLDSSVERPMYVERYWGWYKVLEYGKNQQEQQVLIRRVCIMEGKSLSYHKHLKREELWTFTSGNGVVILEGETIPVQAGSQIRVSRGMCHSLQALSEVQLIETQYGEEILDEDIYRVE